MKFSPTTKRKRDTRVACQPELLRPTNARHWFRGACCRQTPRKLRSSNPNDRRCHPDVHLFLHTQELGPARQVNKMRSQLLRATARSRHPITSRTGQAAARTFASSARRNAGVELTIDGKKVSIEAGSALIQACEKAGVTIPRFCYHEYVQRRIGKSFSPTQC